MSAISHLLRRVNQRIEEARIDPVRHGDSCRLIQVRNALLLHLEPAIAANKTVDAVLKVIEGGNDVSKN